MKDTFKIKLITIGEGIAILFAPTYIFIFAIGFLVFGDLITGILAAKKNKEKITSEKLRNTTRKGVGYMVAILIAHIVQVVFMKEFEVMKIVAGVIGFVELKSIDENFEKAYGFSIFKQFITKGKKS